MLIIKLCFFHPWAACTEHVKKYEKYKFAFTNCYINTNLVPMKGMCTQVYFNVKFILNASQIAEAPQLKHHN